MGFRVSADTDTGVEGLSGPKVRVGTQPLAAGGQVTVVKSESSEKWALLGPAAQPPRTSRRTRGRVKAILRGGPGVRGQRSDALSWKSTGCMGTSALGKERDTSVCRVPGARPGSGGSPLRHGATTGPRDSVARRRVRGESGCGPRPSTRGRTWPPREG